MIFRLAVSAAIIAFGAAAQNGMVCLPSTPAAQTGSSVRLKAWYAGPHGATATFQWSATEGKVRFSKGATIWDLHGARPGAAYADADAIVNGAKAASCTVELRIEGEQPPPSREVPGTSAPAPPPAPPPPPPAPGAAPAPGQHTAISGRAFLAPDQKEPEGFGLYSYILIGAPPAAADRDRYTAVFEAALRLLRPVNELAHYLKTSQLNATWIPVKALPANDPDAKWVVDNYDYSEGAANLVRAGMRNTAGAIYIISVPAPLSHATPMRPFLVQDLSHVPAALASTWVTLFINQAAQEHFWTPNTVDEMVAKMRLAIALSAEGVPAIKTAVATWINISK